MLIGKTKQKMMNKTVVITPQRVETLPFPSNSSETFQNFS